MITQKQWNIVWPHISPDEKRALAKRMRKDDSVGIQASYQNLWQLTKLYRNPSKWYRQALNNDPEVVRVVKMLKLKIKNEDWL